MSDVAEKTKHVESLHEHLDLISALLDGTTAMRRAGEKYLPQWPAEESDHYKFRRNTATLFPAFSRTVEVLSGKPFSKPLQLSDDASTQMQSWCEDIDLEGRNLHSFSADVLEDAMAKGLALVLVEYPQANEVRTRSQEIEAGLRPYFVHIKLEQLLGYRAERINGKWALTQLRFTEVVSEPDGPYLESEIEQIRVIEANKFEIFRKNKKDEWELHEEGETSIPFVPAVPVYGQRKGFMNARPPLLDVAHLNVKHWQSQSAQDTILRVARVPILMLSGFENDGPLVVGMKAITSTEPQADGKFIEHSGAAIGAGRESIQDLEEQMRQSGAELMVDQPVKSVAQFTGEKESSMSGLKRIAIDLEDALNQALYIMAKWVNDNAPTVDVFKDFGSLTLQEASAELLYKIGMSGGLSQQTVFEELKRRGMVRQDRTWEDEQERIEDEGPSLGMVGRETEEAGEDQRE